jgi:hypothetical protein
MVVIMAKTFGFDDLDRALEALPGALEREAERALDDGAARVAVLAKALAPQETGALVGSIHVERTGPLARRVVAGGPETTRDGVDYAAIAEHRTPFMKPAVNALARSVVGRIAGAATSAIRRVLP